MSADKWVRRFSVDQTAHHKNGFTIYKITSVLFPIASPETMTVVSVWKRYSDVQRLHSSMRALHAGLHLRGTFPVLPKYSYFKRFQQEVIEDRARVIKTVLEFVAEHRLLFTSTDFVNFLQTGYPEPENQPSGTINAIRSSLHLPVEDTPPLEYHTSDDESSPRHAVCPSTDETDSMRHIPIHTSQYIERRLSPSPSLVPPSPSNRLAPPSHERCVSPSLSLQLPSPSRHPPSRDESISSLDSAGSDFYTLIDKVQVENKPHQVKRNVLPDLINFDAPSTSRFDDYHTMKETEDTLSLSSTNQQSEFSASTNQRSEISLSSQYSRSNSRVSFSSLSLSNVGSLESKTRTEDSYVFEAGYMLNLAAKYENMKEYLRAFECYKAGIEKMLTGVQSDCDPQRRALIKQKTSKYLAHAEALHRRHLADTEHTLSSASPPPRPLCAPAPPPSLLRRPYPALSQYRVLAALSPAVLLVLHAHRTTHALKVIQKIPNNLTEFDEYFLQNSNETRQPILPTLVPYMVPLQAYIETNNLIFLILSYAPGGKLFDYIKNYTKSAPNTPKREVNLENVFTEPKTDDLDGTEEIDVEDIKIEKLENVSEIKIAKIEANLDFKNENLSLQDLGIKEECEISILDRIEHNESRNRSNNNKTEITNSLDTSELVKNSQKLLRNVDKVLNEELDKEATEVREEDVTVAIDETDRGKRREEIRDRVERRVESPVDDGLGRGWGVGVGSLPPGAVCAWGAQLLTAIQGVHNAGVICRDLNPSNILLGEDGQILLTYFLSYPQPEVYLAKLHNKLNNLEPDLYIAPELYTRVIVEECDPALDRVCDYWSFGAIMYELLCGVPLSYHHRSVFTAHTLLQLPDPLPLEAHSLLTQLLTYSPTDRLGAGPDGADEIKRHPYFKHVDWDLVYTQWTIPQ